MQTIIWRNFRLRLPEDWEMLSFSKNPDKGRCGFMDRYYQRFEFGWRVLPKEPDLSRMRSDYGSRLLNEKNFESTKNSDFTHWIGMTAKKGRLIISRFLRFFPLESCLLELVFHHVGTRDDKVEREVCGSVRWEKPEQIEGESRQHWQAYGMDFYPSQGMPLNECQVLPANVKLQFGDLRKIGGEQTFLRTGLVDQWLRGTVADWSETKAPTVSRIQNRSEKENNGHTITVLRGSITQPTWIPFRVKRGFYRSEAWKCPHDGRLYHAAFSRIVSGKASEPEEDLAGNRLNCCEDLK